MQKIDFFKLQAKNLLRDYKTQFVNNEEGGIYDYKPQFFDVNDIVLSFDIDEDSEFTLMNAQHIIAKLTGFEKWAELINATEARLKLGELFLYIYQNANNNIKTNLSPTIVEEWKMYLHQNNLIALDDESKLRVFIRIFMINGIVFLGKNEADSCEEAIINGEYQNVIKWCKDRLLPYMTRKSINTNHTSYKLKHVCERELGFYVSNGTMKIALYYLGFKGKQDSGGSPNYCYPLQESFFKTVER